jgi:hypothetical protein
MVASDEEQREIRSSFASGRGTAFTLE